MDEHARRFRSSYAAMTASHHHFVEGDFEKAIKSLQTAINLESSKDNPKAQKVRRMNRWLKALSHNREHLHDISTQLQNSPWAKLRLPMITPVLKADEGRTFRKYTRDILDLYKKYYEWYRQNPNADFYQRGEKAATLFVGNIKQRGITHLTADHVNQYPIGLEPMVATPLNMWKDLIRFFKDPTYLPLMHAQFMSKIMRPEPPSHSILQNMFEKGLMRYGKDKPSAEDIPALKRLDGKSASQIAGYMTFDNGAQLLHAIAVKKSP
ncbi:hypothetical protein HY994_04140 [Candidatus Micrarchaeota archaeon]|nr:hypothetical protein [Candidatus Micrarchaeota archaeon]